MQRMLPVASPLRGAQSLVLLRGFQGLQGAGNQALQQQQHVQHAPSNHEEDLYTENTRDPLQFQAFLAARAQQINIKISALHPKSAALKDPEVRKEVERRLKDLERQGLLIKEASKDLETILMERRKA